MCGMGKCLQGVERMSEYEWNAYLLGLGGLG